MKSPQWPVCPYCGRPSEQVTGRTIYPHRPDLFDKDFYLCRPCDAYVGCHAGTHHPLGRLANPALRRLKKAAHAAFDPIWQSGKASRKEAYRWLAGELGIDTSVCHIGEFDEDTCRRVVEVCRKATP